MANLHAAKVAAFKRAMDVLKNEKVGTSYTDVFVIGGVRIEIDAAVFATANDARQLLHAERVESGNVRHGVVGASFTIHSR